MATTTLYLAASVSGNVSTPGNALGAPDSVFTTDGNLANAWTHRWRFDSINGTATGTHSFLIRVRKGSNSGNPVVTAVRLYADGTLVSTLSSGSTSVTSTTPLGLLYNVSGSVLGVLTGKTVDIEVATTSAGGGPSARNAVELDAITWFVSYDTGFFVDSDLASAATSAFDTTTGSTRSADLASQAFAEAVFEDASSYPEAPTDGDILGAELLEYEIIAEAAGASFFDADMASTGSAALALATARVRPSAQSIQGAATVQLPAAAVAASTAASAGSASVSISAARVLLSVASSSGSAAATLLSARVRTANVTAAGAGALSAIASAIAGSSASIAGTTTVSIPASGIRTSTASSSGAGVMSAAAARVIPGAVAASGSAAVTARAASVLPAVALASGSSAVSLPSGKIAAVNAQASGASAMNALGGSTAGAAVNSSGAALLSLLADLIAEARALAAGSSTLDLQSVLLRQGRVDSAAGSDAAFGGLGLAQTITEQDMSRLAELRNMARGAADSLMIAVPGGIGEMERAAESRQMDRGRDEGASSVAGEGSMVRGKESRAMEITS